MEVGTFSVALLFWAAAGMGTWGMVTAMIMDYGTIPTLIAIAMMPVFVLLGPIPLVVWMLWNELT